jgi:MT0933-like antitoxin protein
MPKLKNLAALAAAVEAARRYARSNPDKAAQYLDQAAAFLDKQTKGKYSGHVNNVVGKVKGAAGLPQSSGQGTQSYVANAGYGKHEGYGGGSAVAPDQLTTTAPSTTPPSAASTSPTSTTPSTSVPPASTAPLRETVDPLGTGDRQFPGSKDL